MANRSSARKRSRGALRLAITSLGLAISAAPRAHAAPEVHAGFGHTCALVDGYLHCWGLADLGQLGYGATTNIGDDPGDLPLSSHSVPAGGTVTGFSLGADHTCAVLQGGALRCWGWNADAELGYDIGQFPNVGNSPAQSILSAGDVPLGVGISAVATGVFPGDLDLTTRYSFTCALSVAHRVRCFGARVLGSGAIRNVAASAAADLPLGGDVTQIVAGYGHVCARLFDGTVRCWGNNLYGQLGTGNSIPIGEDQLPPPAVNLGAAAVELTAGGAHTCALLSTGQMSCWGYNFYGQLGLGNHTNRLTPTALSLAGVSHIAAGGAHTCALQTDGAVRCWGDNELGQLGYGDTRERPTPPSTALNVGGSVTQLAAGFGHTCAVLSTGGVRCWGDNSSGQLGYGNTQSVGDTSSPASAGDISLAAPALPLPLWACFVSGAGLLAAGARRLRRTRRQDRG